MGKLSQEPYIHHFSHSHPLELTDVSQFHFTSLAITICSCCSLRSDSGPMYTCRTCTVGLGGSGFSLHVACAQMPALITHPSHPSHPLSLLSATPYPGGSSFNCDACGSLGTAFCYHCAECDFDLHPTCASKPMSVTHPRHHHQLGLEFFPPYSIKAFSCDMCGGTGKCHWLYRCPSCNFDAHLECATSSGGTVIGQALVPPPQPRPALQHYPSYPGSYNNNVVVQHPQQLQPQQYHLQHQNSAPAYIQSYQYQNQPQQMTTIHPNNMTPVGRPVNVMVPAQQMYQPQVPAARPMMTEPTQQIYQQPQQQQQQQQQQQPAGVAQTTMQSFLDSAAQQAGQTMVQNIMGGGGGGDGGGGGGGVGGGGGGDGDSGGSSILGSVLSIFSSDD